MGTTIKILLATLILPLLANAAGAAGSGSGMEIAGPVSAEIVRVIDGDTVLVMARPWPQQIVEVYVRLRGIDAPELKSSCAATRDAGRQALIALENLLRSQGEIRLSRISGDKYFGRVLADISFPDGRNPAQEMLSAGHAVAYAGGQRSKACASFW